MTKPSPLDYKALSIFLLNEAVVLTQTFLEHLNEENHPVHPFYFCGPKDCINEHRRIGKYLRYASIAYELWIPEPELKIDAPS